MHISTTGTAQIKHKTTGEVFEIEAEELEWHGVGSSERQMGSEIEYQAALSHDELGDLTWSLWEYPIGAENHQMQDMNGHELVSNFEISLDHDPDQDFYEESDDAAAKRYFADDDPVGVLKAVLQRKTADEQLAYLTWWFQSYYQDPSHETPYNGREGGFLYIHGGPYDARTEIEQEFYSFIPQEVMDRAIDEVESDGILEWSPSHDHPDRVDDDLDRDERPDDLANMTGDLDRALVVLKAGRQPQFGSREELALRVQIKEALDRLTDELPPDRIEHGGIGHNRPPADERFTAAEIAEIRKSIFVVSTELDKTDPAAIEVVKAAGVLDKTANHVGRLSGLAADEFAKSVGKSAGEVAGKAAGGAIVLAVAGLGLLIMQAIGPILSWLGTILPM